jgi:hypothetical protein
MTCQEIRAHFQGDHFAAVNPLCESAAFSEHVAKCGECNRFIEEQKELAKYFLLLRESTPATSAPLDASVLAAYRLYIAERPHRGAVFSASQIGTLGAFRWAAAIAFALIVGGAVLLLISGHQSRVDQVSTERPRVILPAGVANAKDRAAEPGSVLQKPNSTVRSTKHASHAIPVGLPEDWSSSGFQELMYCDQLSCPEAMDVIRLQLPSAAVGFGPTTSKASDFVYADVLVGPDGIARGIRVLE